MKTDEIKAGKETILRLLSSMRPYRFQAVLALIGTIIQVGLTVYLPILIGQAVNLVLGPGQVQLELLWNLLRQMLWVILANALVQVITPLFYQAIAYSVIRDLRQAALEKIHRLPLSVLDRQSTGDLVARLTTDSEQLADGLIMVFNQLISGLLTIIATIFTMAGLDFLMMVLVVVLTPLSLFVANFIAKRSYKLFQEQTYRRGLTTGHVEESIQLADLISLFNGQDQNVETYEQVNHDYLAYSQEATFISSTINPTTRFINAIIYASLTGLGALRIIQSHLSVGELTSFLNYANQYTKPFNDISNVLAELQSALACAERLFELIDLEGEAETGLQTFDQEELAGKVSFNRVYFSYQPDQDLIEDLTLSISPGQSVAIVGPTGAGKSTLINLLMRFYEPNSGQILIDNQPVTDYTRHSLRSLYGMVLQETWLKTGTIHDNIAYSKPHASRDEVVEAAKQASAHDFIMRLPQAYDTVISNSGESLSAGERQLLSIARIFMTTPTVLILDEATSSIDTRTESLIQAAFAKLMYQRTSFVIAHRLSTIQNSDLILVMKDGNIIEQGTHEELMQARGFYYTLHEAHTISPADP